MKKFQIPISKSQTNPKSQLPNSKFNRFGKLAIGYWLLFGYCFLVIGVSPILAQDADKVGAITQKIISDTSSGEDSYLALEELTELYFKEHKYSEFIEYLNNLGAQKASLGPAVNYYTALTRYYQLKYLEETQGWDEYFSQGNNYRDQITGCLQKTIDATAGGDAARIYARLLLWKFHRDQQTAMADAELDSLVSATIAYAAGAANNLAPLEDVAGQLSLYGEKAKAKEIYKIYVDKILKSDVKDEELKKTAAGFYDDGNLELAENFYDIYIDRIAPVEPKEQFIQFLKDTAAKFCWRKGAPSDTFYAEKIFKRISDIGASDSLGKELIYLRAYSLEKAKNFSLAKDIYAGLISRYPDVAGADKINYKIGLIDLYISADIEAAKAVFKKLAEKGITTAESIASLYQLGLLSQWSGDLEGAKKYYNKLLEKAQAGFIEIVGAAQERLKEVEESLPVEFNLKSFLDASLKEDRGRFKMEKVELKPAAYDAKYGEDIEISAVSNMMQTGCLQVEMSYLWSGDLGQAKPTMDKAAFHTTYSDRGTKVISLVVISPDGVVDRGFDLVDIE